MIKFDEILQKAIDFLKLASGEKVYGPYFLQSGRQIVIIKDENGKTRTVSYPKYLMEQKLNRRLDPNKETIEHKDTNFLNNDFDNLEILPRSEHSKLDTKRVKLIKLTCPICHKEFERSPRLLRDKHHKKSVSGFCSRSCSAKYNRLVQLGKMDKLPVQDYVGSTYYKRKYVNAFVDYVFEKYATPKRNLVKDIAEEIAANLGNLLMDYASFKGGKVNWPLAVGDSKEIWIELPTEKGYQNAIIEVGKSPNGELEVVIDVLPECPKEIEDAINHIVNEAVNKYWYNELPSQQ